MRKKVLTIVTGAFFVLVFILLLLGLLLTRDLLASHTYTQALAESDFYDRVYTDLLADPVVQQGFKEMTGIQINLLSEELYAQVVSALYLILPPQQMETAAGNFFNSLVAYLSGDVPELEENLDLGSALTPERLAERIVQAATAVVVEAIDKTGSIIAQKTEPLHEEDLAAYLANFDEGRLAPIPTPLLEVSVSGFTVEEYEQLVTLMLGPADETASAQTRLQMEAALVEDDLPSAMTTAISERLALQVAEALIGSTAELSQSETLISISRVAGAIGQTRDALVNLLNSLRRYAGFLQLALVPMAVILLFLLLIIVWLNNSDFPSALRAAGWALIIASGSALFLWLIVTLILTSQLDAVQFGPASLDGMIDDFLGSLINELGESIWRITLVLLIGSALFLLVGYSEKILYFCREHLSPVWTYRWWVLGGFIIALIFIPLLLDIFRADIRRGDQPCNGYRELCDRPINEVVYAATHNSMSIAEYGWIWPMHDGTFTDQLNAGVRALLIDTHYIEDSAQREAFVNSLPPKTGEVMRHVLSSMDLPEQGGAFLCHGLCALGWTELSAGLDEIRVFLEENPREVLFLIIQDEISPEDTADAVEHAGLLPYVYAHPAGAPWPTLREMIDSGRRLVITAENEGPPPDWYMHVWDIAEETPYTFITPDQFSCAPNRGGSGKPFFLLNHWIQRGSPNRVDAAVVNEYDFLLRRAQQCAAERGQIPNFVAVNWYGQGDLFAVVDSLNGVADPQE